MKKRLLLLFSDTGGGHRSAAEAVIEATEAAYPGRFDIAMVDVLKEYAPPPLNRLPSLYPDMVRFPALWEMGYRLTDGPRRVKAINRTGWPYVRRAIRRLIRDHTSDLVVSVHPLFVAPYVYARRPGDAPFLVVVTDLVSTHSLWYHPETDYTFVPTEQARQRAIRNGVSPQKIGVSGLPVSQRFCTAVGDRTANRRAFDWPADLPMILLLGGGEGMGPILPTARALADLDLDLGLAIVTGRNAALEQSLKSMAWEKPVFVYGFERRMPELMRAADMIVTKAGPGTITEAINAHLPLVLYSRLPGQEDGNVDYVVEQGLGVWAPEPIETAQAVRCWLEDPGQLRQTAERCAEAARPEAAFRIAESIFEQLESTDAAPAGGGSIQPGAAMG